MKEIENEFQTVADEIICESTRIDEEKSRIVSRFFALWCLRFKAKYRPTPEDLVEGIVGERLSKDEEELLEANRVGYFRSDQTMPGRVVSGMLIQMSIDKFEADFRGIRWGIAIARQAELILPDTFGRFAFVPVTPTMYLVCGSEGRELSLPRNFGNKPAGNTVGATFLRCERFRSVPVVIVRAELAPAFSDRTNHAFSCLT